MELNVDVESMTDKKTAIIIGAGPAGLTAAYELLEKSDIIPIIYEQTDEIGGISRTVNHNGNRLDMGGHRFFSKSDVIMEWWFKILPYQGAYAKDDLVLGRTFELSSIENAPDPEQDDDVMLQRGRLSRIFFLRKFFAYPISLSIGTLKNLGLLRISKIGFTYLYSKFFPKKNEKSLQDFFVNRFGSELYRTFFRDYTEKVWGIHCKEIPSEWGAQRIKGLSITTAIKHALATFFTRQKTDMDQKNVETSLIERFLYPKFGPGQLWEKVAERIIEKGGQIHFNSKCVSIHQKGDQVVDVEIAKSEEKNIISGDFFISTMPVKELIAAMPDDTPLEVKNVAQGLVYRDFLTVGLLVDSLAIQNQTSIKTINNIVPDNWIYIQEADVKLGRLQIFNNWSPYMVQDLNKSWVGLEYFCNEGDALWDMPENEFIQFAIDELIKIKILSPETRILDSVRIEVPKAYPAYFGSYDQFDVIKDYVNTIQNLYLVGRNGMHRYNNMDHSMLAAIKAVENITTGKNDKTSLWDINIESEYHEEK